jgi:branched-chain amino acid transport system ATP-binding protein
MPRLAIDNIHVSYGKVKALKGLSLFVEKNEVVAIVGANGAGKSTLLKSIMGLIPLEAGRIQWGLLELNKLSSAQIVRGGIAISPEGRRLFTELDVQENLELGAYQADRKKITENLETIYEYFPILKERRKQQAASLSGGQQQMVAIGRAMMSNPHLLLLDEPSLGLSPLMAKEIFKIIRQIKSKGITVILVEQNAKAALQLCDRAYVMQNGIITMTGEGKELINNEEVKRSYLGK